MNDDIAIESGINVGIDNDSVMNDDIAIESGDIDSDIDVGIDIDSDINVGTEY